MGGVRVMRVFVDVGMTRTGVLTYPNSPDYRPDIDSLTPVQVSEKTGGVVTDIHGKLQASVIDIVQAVDLAESGVPSLIMRDLAEFSSLAFLAGFHTHPTLTSAPGSPITPMPTSTRKQITYIGLSKKTMPTLVELYMRFKDHVEIYEDGTLEAVLSVSPHLSSPSGLLSLLPAICGSSCIRRLTGSRSSSSMNVQRRPSLARTCRFGRRQRRVSCVS